MSCIASFELSVYACGMIFFCSMHERLNGVEVSLLKVCANRFSFSRKEEGYLGKICRLLSSLWILMSLPKFLSNFS